MPSRSTILVLLLILTWGTAVAVVDPEPDKIGIYFDETGDQACEEISGLPFTLVPAAIILTRPTMAEITGWEAAVHSADGELLILNPEVAGDGTATVVDGRFQVAYETPLATTEATVLARMDLVAMDGEECLHLSGVDGVQRPRIRTEDGSMVEIRPTAFFDNGVGAVLGTCAVIIGEPFPCSLVTASERLSWGAVKARFR